MHDHRNSIKYKETVFFNAARNFYIDRLNHEYGQYHRIFGSKSNVFVTKLNLGASVLIGKLIS